MLTDLQIDATVELILGLLDGADVTSFLAQQALARHGEAISTGADIRAAVEETAHHIFDRGNRKL